MKMTKYVAGLMVLGALSSAPAFAKDSDSPDNYKATGESENCISLSSIRTTKVLDGTHILFKMNNGKIYMNTLPHECGSLDFYEAFSYKVHGSQLCSVDTISVLTGGNVPGPTCGLGTFEEVEKTDASNGDQSTGE